MTCQQYDFIIVAEHGVGSALFDYLRLFDELSLFVAWERPLTGLQALSSYNGICFRDINSKNEYYDTIKVINAQKEVSLCVLTRDPLLQMVSIFNLWMFNVSLAFLGQVPVTLRGRFHHKLLLHSSGRRDFFSNWILQNDLYFNHSLLEFRLLPFLKKKANKIYIIDINDILPENIYSTMDYFKRNFFNSEIDYTRVNVNISANSIYTGWMFAQIPTFQYSSNSLTFSLRPRPLQLNCLQCVPENTYISYEPNEVEWTCGKFDGKLAFNLVHDNNITPQMLMDIMSRIKGVCETDDKRLLT